MTIIRTLPFAYAGAGALDPIEITQFELDLAANVNCLSWWRADVGFAGTWSDRKSGSALVPNRTGTPAIATPANYNGKRALSFGTGSANGCLQVANGMPVDADYSFVFVGHAPHLAGTQTLWADAQASSRTAVTQHQTTNSLNITHSGSTILANTGGPALSLDSPNIILWSYKKSGKVGKYRLNGAEVQTGRTNSLEITDGTLQMATQGEASAQAPWTNGYIAEFIVFDFPLADLANADLLAALEEYLLDRYDVTA